MMGKLFAGGLLLVACLGLLTVRVSSQDQPAGATPAAPQGASVSLEQMVQELKNVRAQKTELDKREKQLVERIAKAIQEQRQQLDRIEGLLYPDGRGNDRYTTKEEKKDYQGRTEKKRAP
jgi:hypothetical protein